MLNFDLNNDAVFAGATGNGADLAVVVGREHRCLPRCAHKLGALKPLGKRLLTAYCTTPAATRHPEHQSEGMSMSSGCSVSWHRQPRPASARRPSGQAAAPAIWASLIIQQSL